MGHLDVAGGVVRVDSLALFLLRRALRRTPARVSLIDPVPDLAAVALLLQVSASFYNYKCVTQS